MDTEHCVDRTKEEQTMRKPSPSILLLALLTLTTAVSAAACGSVITGGGTSGNSGAGGATSGNSSASGGGGNGPSDKCPDLGVPDDGSPCLTEGAMCAYADTCCAESTECHGGKWVKHTTTFPPPPLIELKGPAISFLASQLPSPGDGVDPNTLTVRIGDIQPMCTDLAANPPCGNHWFVTYDLPPAMQQAGAYDLANLKGGFDLSAECSGSGIRGGSLGTGTITIQHVDAQGVDFTLDGSFYEFGYVKDTFHAPRCP